MQKRETSISGSNENETNPFHDKNINNIRYNVKNINEYTEISFLSNHDLNQNKSLIQIIKDIINKENFGMFKIIFKENKAIFFRNFINISNDKIKIEEINRQFIYTLHVCVNNNLYSFVEIILSEFKSFLESNKLNEIVPDQYYWTDIVSDIESDEIKDNFFRNYINSIDNLGYSSIHYAIINGNIKLINLLIENKADVTIRTKNGYSCLHLAASINKLEIFIYLYEKFKDVLNLEDKDYQDNAIIHIVCYHSSFDILEFILSKKISINVINKKGNSPLHYAVFNGIFFLLNILNLGNKKIVKRLLLEGGKIKLKNNNNETPYDYAIKYKLEKIMNIFDNYLNENSNTMCILKPGLKKPEKNNYNFYLFIILHLLLESIIFFFILPSKYFFEFLQF